MRTPLLIACLLLAACAKAPSPVAAEVKAATAASADVDASANASAPADTGHHELKEGIDAVDYRGKAQAAGDATLEADKKHDEELRDAGG
jgi:membrane-bound lytic murein transglycosylase B